MFILSWKGQIVFHVAYSRPLASLGLDYSRLSNKNSLAYKTSGSNHSGFNEHRKDDGLEQPAFKKQPSFQRGMGM